MNEHNSVQYLANWLEKQGVLIDHQIQSKMPGRVYSFYLANNHHIVVKGAKEAERLLEAVVAGYKIGRGNL